jgi:glycosyltransferase involved in cell wall biosynthesis
MAAVIGIDASRNRSGGAKAHLIGILGSSDPSAHGIEEVHVWSYSSLLDSLPQRSWLIKHNPPDLERGLGHQVWWQYRSLPVEARQRGCEILLNTDAGTVCPFRPAVVMSRDMVSYEPGIMGRYGLTRAGLRIFLLKYVQAYSMRRADGVVFLTKYAADVIRRVTGPLPRISIIPHGVGDDFRCQSAQREWTSEKAVRCLYVSHIALFKNQWVLVKAMGILRSEGLDVSLVLAGDGGGRARKLVEEELARTDPRGEFVRCLGQVEHRDISSLMADADLFVFPSACENMPNTLVEAMASGLPIACSNRGPMPEVLQDGGVYFDPDDADSMADAIRAIISDNALRARIMARAKDLSAAYSWERCGKETWEFLRATLAALRRDPAQPVMDGQ